MSFVLKHSDQYKGDFYFCNLGLQWPRRPELRMIERTSNDIKEARVFKSEDEANEVLVIAGKPAGWEVVPNL